MKWIILLTFLIFPNRLQKEPVIVNYKVTYQKDRFKELLNFIKEHEGLMLNVYVCPGGIRTIGYGHSLTHRDKFTTITEQQADSLLISDVKQALDFVKKVLPELNKNQTLAITHFVYSVGAGNLMKSSLYKNLKRKQDITKSLLCWNKIKNKTNKQLLKQRIWELNLFYNYEIQTR